MSRASWPLPRTCRALLCCVMLLAAQTAGPAPGARAAGATLQALPAANLPHGSEQISGGGFDPLAAVSLSVRTSAGTIPAGTLVADNTGAIGGTITLPLSLDVALPNTIVAQEAGGGASASADVAGVAVTPTLGADSTLDARIGALVQVRGIGFAPTEPISITVGGAQALLRVTAGNGPLSSGADGTLVASFDIPYTTQLGPTTIVATGGANGLGQQDRAVLPITIVGAQGLAVTPTLATAGHQVALTGGGFVPNEPVTCTLSYSDTVTGATAVAMATASSDGGGRIDARITVPATAQAGSAVIVARGQLSGATESATLTVQGAPSLEVFPPSALPGSSIALHGARFKPGERLLLTTQLFTPPDGGLLIDETGGFTLVETLRSRLAPGVYDIGVSGAAGDQAGASLTVPASPMPRLSASPTTLSPGDLLRLQGAPFLPGEPVGISLDTIVLTPTGGPAIASGNGDLTATVRIPAVESSGIYDLTASGLRTGASSSLLLNLRLPVTSRTYFAEGYTGQGPGVTFAETIDMLNTTPFTASGRIEYFLGGGATQTVPITVPAHMQISEDVVRDVGPNQLVSALVESDRTLVARRTISRTAGGMALGASGSYGSGELSPFWYFAEGYTGVTFQPYLALFNPGDSRAAVTVRAAGTAGSAPAAPLTLSVPPRGRVSINLRSAFPNRSLGVLVQSNQPIAAERTLYWGAGAGSSKYGCAVNAGSRAPSPSLVFPYASTAGGDQVFLALTNSTTTTAHAQIIFIGEQGSASSTLTATVDPGARTTVTLPARGASPASIVLTSDVPLVGEEAQYFGGSPNDGAHGGSVLGSLSQPSTTWAFTGQQDQGATSARWYVLNSGEVDAQLSVSTYNTQGEVRNVRLPAAPAGRLTTLSNTALQGTSPSVWTSSTAVSIIEVIRGQDNQGTALQGVSLD